MNLRWLPLGVLALAVTGFIALGLLYGHWQRVEEKIRPHEYGLKMRVTPVEIKGENGQLQLASNSTAPAEEHERVRKQEMERQLDLLAHGGAAEKRDAALRLQLMADPTAEPKLLQALNDPDPKVAQRCAKTLLTLWQATDSPTVNRILSQGIAAYEAARYDEALESFQICARLDPQIPDLYRLRAEILLEKRRLDDALEDCQKALMMKNTNFMALYTQARCYLEKRDGPAALEIYGTFQQAHQLKTMILSLQQAGEL